MTEPVILESLAAERAGDPGIRQRPTLARSRITTIDGLRGMFAVSVLVYHYTTWADVRVSGPLGWWIEKMGIYAVLGFFIISGLSMFHAYEGANLFRGSAARQFYLKRYLRIAPLYLFCCGLNIAAYRVLHLQRLRHVSLARDLLLNSTFVFGFFQPAETALPIGGWSIGIEFVFYFFFPLLLWSCKGLGRVVLLTILAGLAACTWTTLVLDPNHSLASQWSYYVTPLAYGHLFLAGALIHRVNTRYAVGVRTAAVGFVTCLMVYLFYGNGFHDQIEIVTGTRGIVYSVAAICMVYCASNCRWPVRSMESAGRFLGDISYSVYLLHPFIYYGVQRLHPSRLVGLAAAFVLVIPAAAVTYRFVERPFMRRRAGLRTTQP